MIAIGQWCAAVMKLSADARDSLSLILVVGLLFAFISFGHRFLPDDRHALWKNIYFWSSDTESSDSVFFALFVIVANAVNNAAGRPPRSGLAGLVLIAGLTGILVISGLFASRLPRIRSARQRDGGNRRPHGREFFDQRRTGPGLARSLRARPRLCRSFLPLGRDHGLRIDARVLGMGARPALARP